MWTFSRPLRSAIVAVAFSLQFCVEAAHADNSSNGYQNNAQYGIALPYVSLPNGQDEIKTADGTSCRSAVGGDGAYLDTGVIGMPESQDLDASASVYGRIVIPLGKTSKRLDCSRLYDLEIQRLQMELSLARMSLQGGASEARNSAAPPDWQNEGWTNTNPEPTAALPLKTTDNPRKPLRKASTQSVLPVQTIQSIY